MEVVEEGQAVGVHALRASRVLVTGYRLAVLEPSCDVWKSEREKGNLVTKEEWSRVVSANYRVHLGPTGPQKYVPYLCGNRRNRTRRRLRR